MHGKKESYKHPSLGKRQHLDLAFLFQLVHSLKEKIGTYQSLLKAKPWNISTPFDIFR